MKKKVIGFIAGGAALLTAVVSVTAVYANAATKVNTYKVSSGEMSQVIELNGTTASNSSENYFAGANLKVDEIKVQVGDTVKKGDVLVTFDQGELESEITLVNLNAQAQEGSYNNQVQTSDKYAKLYNEANRNLGTIDAQINETLEAILNKKKEINARASELAAQGVNVQVGLINEDAGSDAYDDLLKAAQNNAYAQQYDGKLYQLGEELARLNNMLTELKETKAEMLNQKTTGYVGIMTEGAKSELDAMKEVNDINNNKTLEALESAKEGIKADFDGVVSQISVTEGQTIGKDQIILTVDSLDDAVIKCYANKYDIINIREGQEANCTFMNNDLTGEVTRVAQMAGSDSQNLGVGVDVAVDADENYILGMDVKVKLVTSALEDVISVPTEAIVVDGDKKYVFVNSGNEAKKTLVETGIANDEYTEITSGLKGGETVVWSSDKELKDGDSINY